MSKKFLNINKIIELHSQGLNDNEIARIVGASVNGVRYVRKNKFNLPHNIKHYTITKEMDEILVGTILGDAWVGYTYSGCYPKYEVCHCEKQKTYIMTIYNKLKTIMTDNIGHNKCSICKFNNKEYKSQSSYRIGSHNMRELVIYREAFYPNGKKIIPIDFIRDRFTALSLACLYMDDGSFDISSNSFIINTQYFSRENLEEFTKFLYEKFGLEFTIKKDCSLYLRHKCNELFKSLVKNYITEDMKYKLGCLKTPLNREHPNIQDNPVLNPQEIEENAKRLEVMPNKQSCGYKILHESGALLKVESVKIQNELKI